MRRGVDAARESADDCVAGECDLEGKLLCRLGAVVRDVARADDADGVCIGGTKVAPHVEDDRRIVDRAERRGIFGRIHRDHFRAEIRDAFQFRDKIHAGVPRCDGVGGFLADAFHCAQRSAARGEDALRSLKCFEQRAQPHRAHPRHHVEGDAGFRVSHARGLSAPRRNASATTNCARARRAR